jgi:preprotein translocase subunit YajC
MISQLLLQAASGGGGVSTLVMLAGMFAIMYLFMIRPQMKRQKEAKTFREAVKKGDQVVTIGGIHGKVVSVSDKTVVLEFENGKARVDKTALSPTGTADTQNIEAANS